MSRKVYIGIDGLARKIKKGYIGIPGDRSNVIKNTANQLLFTYGSRNYKKAYAGDAICASAIVNGWLWPVLIAKTNEAVTYITDGDYNATIQARSNTLTYRGEIWYISGDGGLFQTTSIPSGIININTITGKTYTTYADAALDLLDYYFIASDARYIRKAYIGVAGVARPCWFENKLLRYGDIGTTTTGRTSAVSGANSNYAIFAGGDLTINTLFNNVDAFDSNYTYTEATTLHSPKTYLASASSETHVLISGGATGSDGHYNITTNITEAFDNNLTKSTATSLSFDRAALCGGDIGNYHVIHGGMRRTTTYSAVDFYQHGTLTRSNSTSSIALTGHCSAKTPNHLIFASGFSSRNVLEYSTKALVYNNDLTYTSIDFNTPRWQSTGTYVGDYALFAGGVVNNNTIYDVINVYDDNLTQSILHLPTPLWQCGSGSIGSYAAIAGGYDGTNAVGSVESYNVNLVRETIEPLSSPNSYIPSATINNSIIFYSTGNMQVYRLQ